VGVVQPNPNDTGRPTLIDHISTYATNFSATKAFYDAALATLGYSVQAEMVFDTDPDLPGRRACAYGPKGDFTFWVVEVLEPYSPRHVAFAAADRQSVAEFHRAGLAAGGEDNGAPGLRPIYHEHYYGSFLTDPDGNNVEAVCSKPEQ
jgi:catechol 2,3-dioxygenase-like lactoylglutathione lyase family enzyme